MVKQGCGGCNSFVSCILNAVFYLAYIYVYISILYFLRWQDGPLAPLNPPLIQPGDFFNLLNHWDRNT